MSYTASSDWAKNKDSSDIVYSFVTSEEIRYRKENGHIYEITVVDTKTKIRRRVPESELSAAEFDRMKKISDAIFHSDDSLTVNEARNNVDLSQAENTLAASVRMDDEDDEKPKPRTMADANKMLRASKLTPEQRRRFLMWCRGMSTYEIAEIEGVNHSSVWRSIQAAEEKRNKYLKNFRSDMH